MRYLSTRGDAPTLAFADVLLEGLARDGGLYVPERWPNLSSDQWHRFRGEQYAKVAVEVMWPFVDGQIQRSDFERIVCAAYSRFRHHSIAPLVQIGPDEWVMELFHGPTLAFKDVAMQVLGGLFDHVLEQRDQRLTIVGATSGDTGSAAIEAVRGRERADIFILHPHGRTSEVQRRQMTTVTDANVHNIAIQGTFDDCQHLVKAMFNDTAFRDRHHLSGVNSINWARVLPQAVYYVTAVLALGGLDTPEAIRFSVPTGNFGDVYAGYIAYRMGQPIGELIVASNSNDILPRVFNTGKHELGQVQATISPSMDIQISSNFERLLFEMYGRDPRKVVSLMRELKESKRFDVSPESLATLAGLFSAERVDEDRTLATIEQVYRETGYVLDPHTAVGVAASRIASDVLGPVVTLATAHPAKFPDAVAQATGSRPALPPFLADLYERDERYDVLPNDLQAVQNFIAGRTRA
jgi:threonine synthase